MRIFVYLILLLLTGCTTFNGVQKPRDTYINQSSSFIELNKFPDPKDYGDIERDSMARNNYVNAVNWYLMISYARVKIINDYAKDKGWVPPETKPVCRLVKWPKLKDMPTFVSKHSNNSSKFKWELTNYIGRLQSVAEDNIKTYDDTLADQIELCVY